MFWRGLVAECLDPLYLRSVSGIGALVHFVFLALVVLNLVSGFQALGTLLVGRHDDAAGAWRRGSGPTGLRPCALLAVLFGMVSGVADCSCLTTRRCPPVRRSCCLRAGSYLVSLIGGRRGLIQSRLAPAPASRCLTN